MMTKQFQQTLIFAYLFLLAVMFQNFDVKKIWNLPVSQVSEDGRAQHAKELLGRFYDKSPASKAENLDVLHLAIYSVVHNSLPKKYKNKSLEIASTIIEEAEKYQLDPVFLMAVIQTESSFNPAARGGIGEIGLMQLRPCTAEWISKRAKVNFKGNRTLLDPVQNIKLGAFYFHHLRSQFSGQASEYLAAYNMGATKVRRIIAENRKPRVYSMKVMTHYKQTYHKLIAKSAPEMYAQN